MGEIHHCSGKILFKRDKKISYAPQNPWLLRGTIRENILRGLEFNENRYKKVIEACCLKYDLENFPEIDRKDVGLRGCKVSGGQRARINLAATIYRNADIYLLDDIFSALDVHVCDEIFDKCILKFLKNKTRLICTNQNKYIDSFDQIFYIENKTVAIKNTEINETISSSSSRLISLSNRSSITIHENEDADEDENIVNISIENKLMSYVSTKNYLKYLNHGPKIGMGILLISILLYTTSKCISDWWLTDYLNTNTQNMTQNNGIGNPLIVFSYFIGAVILFAFIRAFSFSYIFIKICTKIHNHMISLIFTARFYYYENAKIGNIINKFLTDMYAIDETIPFTINIFISLFFNLLGIIALICVSAPIFLCIIPILIPFLIYLQHVYRRTTK
ncbi:hypothetical protein HZS_2769 [Henneguya salminicola]|nr:hypothetical protein HZS_2769 [Henneguya salminicola]